MTFVCCRAVLLLVAAAVPAAEAGVPAESPPSVFELPRLQARFAALHAEIANLFREDKPAEAELRCRDAARLVPHHPNSWYNLACALARQNKLDEAQQSLAKAVSLGFHDVRHIEQDRDLDALKNRDDFQQLLKQAATAKPEPQAGWKFSVTAASIQDGVALVTEQNTAWDARLGVFRTLFKFAENKSDKPVVNGFGQAGDWLRAWSKQGTAAGNHGDLYDNHDSDHSNMDYGAFPHLARIEFSDAAKTRHLHHGLQLMFLYNAPTIGNSSTAITAGPFWRSQSRNALTNPRGPQLLYLQYVSNQLYFYPEHRDHDPGHNGADGKGHGDVFPANVPYLITSQGSSGSDRAFLHAVCATLAAFRPEVKTELVRTGTLMPAVQMIFRSSNKMVTGPQDYLAGTAHPTVFDSGQLDIDRMLQMAHDMTPETLPPMVQLKAVDEDQAAVGVDYFAVGETERLFDTPCAIARVVRSTKYVRRLVVSAEGSRDLQRRPLTYHWSVLRGDPERIRINRRNAAGSVVELLIPYHERRPIAPGAALESNRVDIGAFVKNDKYYSAPGFVSLYYLDNEKRTYDAQQRIAAVDYADPHVGQNYVDPAVDLRKNWRDEYRYGVDGRPLGWTRFRGQDQERFTAAGHLVVKTDDKERPIEAKPVRYVARLGAAGVSPPANSEPRPGRRAGQPPVLEQQVTEEIVRYEYSSPEDRAGSVVK